MRYRSFDYIEDNFLKSGDIIWKCTRTSCSACLKTNKDGTVKSHRGKHNHRSTSAVDSYYDKIKYNKNSKQTTDENQSGLLLDNSHVNVNPSMEKNDVNDDKTKSETLNFILSEPFTLKDSSGFIDKESEGLEDKSDEKSDENKQVHIQDLINKTVQNEFPLNLNTPNVDESTVDEQPTTNVDCSKESCEKNENQICTPSEITPTSTENLEISPLKDDYKKNKRFKSSKFVQNNTSVKTDIEMKACSVVVEKTVANNMKVTDVFNARQGNFSDSVLNTKTNTQSSSITQFEGSTRPQSNRSSSCESVVEIENSSVLSQNLKTNQYKRKSKTNKLILECSSKSRNSTLNKRTQSTRKEENTKGCAIPVSIDSRQETKHANLVHTSPNMHTTSVKECTQPKRTYNKVPKRTPQPHKIPQEVTPLHSVDPTDVNQVFEYLNRNKALSIKPVNNAPLLKPRPLPTLLPNHPDLPHHLKITDQIQNNYTSSTPPTTSSSNNLTKEQKINSNIKPKEVDLEEILDGAPPFIQEVLKCDNIRDGFINEDLIFVLSLLPDMEEMADNEKIQFQLKVIEMITEVLNDPVLKS